MVQVETIIEKLNMLFSIGDYENAQKLLESARKVPELYNDTVAIYDANLALNKGNYPEMWEAIRRGLEHNSKNYELYVMLGEYYLNINPNQAYLCFENALFYCDNETDYAYIQGLINSLKEENNITVNNVSFIILSYNTLEYTQTCIDSIRQNTMESCREIIIVDNASTDGSVEWLRQQTDIILRENKENSGFPKGCNEGIALASEANDIFLLNNDTLLPPNALFWLRMGLYESDEVGTTGSVTNYAANLQALVFREPCLENYLGFAAINNIPKQYPYEEKLYLIGFALLIKRATFEKVGLLDERFSPGNYEDNDYGLRVLQAGYKNVLCKNSFIIHFGSKSFGKVSTTHMELLNRNAQKFKEKWNLNPNYYFLPRPELVDLVVEEKETALHVLEIGCGCCATSAYLKSIYPNIETYGVEIVPEAASIAQHISNVICADIETLNFPWEKEFFDYIILGDVLEHLHNPVDVLKSLYKHVKTGGHLIISMPNVKHYSVILPLLVNDEFTYADAGILDTTHLKMYTRKEILRLVERSGYKTEQVKSVTLGSPSEDVERIINHLLMISTSKDRDEYLTYQYLVKAKK